MVQGNGKKQPTNRLGRGLGKPFQKGTSGNPKGRPPGPGLMAQFTALIDESDGERRWTLMRSLLDKAEAGDMAAMRLILDRTDPTTTTVNVAAVTPEEAHHYLDGVTVTHKRNGAKRQISNGLPPGAVEQGFNQLESET